jgi:uncharacterized protein (UPF0276 family)
MHHLVQVGMGLRCKHYAEVANSRPQIGWLEVHSENFFAQGGQPLSYLKKIGNNYPISFHGVGLSLGSATGIPQNHLRKLKNLITIFSPCLVSEHLSWSAAGGMQLPDLLPLPYTEESLTILTDRINQVQNTLNRQILIENISTYLQFKHSVIPEYEFINALAQRTQCGVLLDINNLYVNSRNHGWQTDIYLNSIGKKYIKELHLGGHIEKKIADSSILIDTHNQPVSMPVWGLYSQALHRFGPLPTLIEWDQDIPALNILLAEVEKARQLMEKIHAHTA